MAFYSQRITIPANTPKDNPYTFDIPLEEKWIEDIWVGFEDGAAWMVGVRIYYGIRRYFPENQEEWIYGNDIFIPIRQIVQLPAKQEYIRIIAHSEGTKYPHDIIIYVWTSEEEPKSVGVALRELIDIFRETFGV